MKQLFTRVLTAFIGISAASIGGASAQQNYPDKTVKIVVPSPPGTLLDLIPRVIADKLSQKWGQPVIIDTRPGAAQNLGAEVAYRAKGDGYTLLFTPPGPLAVSKWFFPKIEFEPDAFVPISLAVKLPTVLVINPRLGIKNLPELIAYAKANPNKINYGSPGTGSTPQLAMEALTREAGISFVHVPYQGMGPAQIDLLAGHIDVMIDLVGNALPAIQDGRLKALAVTGDSRSLDLPNVPMVVDTIPGFTHTEWFSFVAPPKTSPELAAKLSLAIADVLRQPDMAKKFKELSVVSVGSTPAELASFAHQQSERWRQVIAATARKTD